MDWTREEEELMDWTREEVVFKGVFKEWIGEKGVKDWVETPCWTSAGWCCFICLLTLA